LGQSSKKWFAKTIEGDIMKLHCKGCDKELKTYTIHPNTVESKC